MNLNYRNLAYLQRCCHNTYCTMLIIYKTLEIMSKILLRVLKFCVSNRRVSNRQAPILDYIL